VAALALAEHDRLRRAGCELRLTGALVRDPARPRGGPNIPLHTTSASLFRERADVVIDVMGGEHPAFELTTLAIGAGAHIVSANKTLVALRGGELAALAAEQGVAFLFDAAVLAGVPFVGALSRRPFIGGPVRIAGIINGTSHFVVDRMADGGSLASALDEAVARGYAEPDSDADVSGRDAAEKLAILLRLSGCAGVTVSHLTRCGLGELRGVDLLGARALGAVVKPVALASLDAANPGAWVGPALVDASHPFASLAGVANAIQFENGIGDPVTFAGPGAGPRVTAATILDDVVEAVARERSAAQGPPSGLALRVPLRRPAAGPWYVRVVGGDLGPGGFAEALAARGLPVERVVRCGRALVARTGAAPWSRIVAASSHFTQLHLDALALPIVGASPIQSASTTTCIPEENNHGLRDQNDSCPATDRA
jgi:homoserine dehydrogenase